jgi:hypothetical protein
MPSQVEIFMDILGKPILQKHHMPSRSQLRGAKDKEMDQTTDRAVWKTIERG